MIRPKNNMTNTCGKCLWLYLNFNFNSWFERTLQDMIWAWVPHRGCYAYLWKRLICGEIGAVGGVCVDFIRCFLSFHEPLFQWVLIISKLETVFVCARRVFLDLRARWCVCAPTEFPFFAVRAHFVHDQHSLCVCVCVCVRVFVVFVCLQTEE